MVHTDSLEVAWRCRGLGFTKGDSLLVSGELGWGNGKCASWDSRIGLHGTDVDAEHLDMREALRHFDRPNSKSKIQ